MTTHRTPLDLHQLASLPQGTALAVWTRIGWASNRPVQVRGTLVELYLEGGEIPSDRVLVLAWRNGVHRISLERSVVYLRGQAPAEAPQGDLVTLDLNPRRPRRPLRPVVILGASVLVCVALSVLAAVVFGW